MLKKINGYFVLIAYKIILDIIYTSIIFPIFSYSGFTYEFNLKKYIIFWLIFIAFFPSIVKLYKKNTASQAILLIFFLASFIPGLVLFSFMETDTEFIFLYIIYWIFFLVFNRIFPVIEIKIEKNKKNRGNLIYLLTVIFSLFVVFLSWKYTGFRLNFNLLNVYELRHEASDFNFPAVYSYLFSSAKIVLPIIFIYFYDRNKKYLALFILFIQFLAFSIDGSKATIFSIIITFVIYRFIKKISLSSFSISVLSITILAFLETKFFNTINIINFLIRRAFFLPNLLNLYYYDFFSVNSKDIFRQGIFGRIGFDSPYSMPIPSLIGYNYFNSDSMRANNGLFSDAYSNLGIFGIMIMPLLIIILLKILDGCTTELPFRILIAAIITSAFTLISSSFFTVLFTHGFIIVCLVFLIMPKINSERKMENERQIFNKFTI